MKSKFEAVKEHNGPWTVKTQIRKGGNWYTVAETSCVPGVGDSKEIAEIIATILNDRMEAMQMAKKILKKLRKEFPSKVKQ